MPTIHKFWFIFRSLMSHPLTAACDIKIYTVASCQMTTPHFFGQLRILTLVCVVEPCRISIHDGPGYQRLFTETVIIHEYQPGLLRYNIIIQATICWNHVFISYLHLLQLPVFSPLLIISWLNFNFEKLSPAPTFIFCCLYFVIIIQSLFHKSLILKLLCV